MRKFRFRGLLALVSVFALVAVACGEEPTTAPPAGGGSGTDTSTPAEDDLLAQIMDAGVIRVATDQKYKPQSFVEDGEWKGFDVDVANEVAARLGVTAEIEHQPWSIVSNGSWNEVFDMSVGSMTVTEERATDLFDFTPAYYYTPAQVAVHSDNTSITDLETDLDGKRICLGVDTTYEAYVMKTLSIPGYTFDFVIDDAVDNLQSFDTDTDALDQLALGDGVQCDAVITAGPTIDSYVADGNPVKIVGDPLYGEPLAIAFDKNVLLDNAALVDAVSQIVEDMHADGTLSSLSEKWYGKDITVV